VLAKVLADSLARKPAAASDPFQQFMMEIDSAPVSKEEEDDTEIILTLFHIIQSVANLQLQSEAAAFNGIAGSTELIKRLGAQAKGLIGEEDKTVRRKILSVQLVKFYHQIANKIIDFASKKNLDTKEILSEYVETLLSAETVVDSMDELYGFLKSLVAVSGEEALVAVLLLCHGKESVAVKDNLELESTEIKLVQRLCGDSRHVLAFLEELIYIITSIPMSDE